MPENRVDAALAQDDVQEVLEAIRTIGDKLPFLIDLTSDEKRSMPKLGDRSRAFVAKALEVAKQNPDFLPRYFDIDSMERDVELFNALQPITTAISQLSELLDDTVHAVGSEAYVDALAVYQFAKNSASQFGLDDVVDEMGKRFAKRTATRSNSDSELEPAGT